MKNTVWIMLILLSTIALASCGTPENMDKTVVWDETAMEQQTSSNVVVGGAEMTPNLDIVANAMNSTDHTTLVAAVSAAGLVETLQSAWPFTVFAPTNEAFSALPEWTVEALLQPENLEQLQAVLTYHVVSGEYFARDLEDGLTLTTVQWDEITFTYQDNVWYVNNAEISIVDAKSSNGVTHVIEWVLVPSAE